MTATYDPIATTTLGSAASTITFSSIPATFTDLRIVLVCQGGARTNVFLRFNSDTGTNYSSTRLRGNGSTASSAQFTNASQIQIQDGLPLDFPGLVTMDVFSYAGSTNKTALVTVSTDENTLGYSNRIVGLWRNTAAITTIDIVQGASTTFNSGTTATLYGIKAE